MKKLVLFLVLFTAVTTSSLKSYSTDPKFFVQELVTEAIGKLSDKSLEISSVKEKKYQSSMKLKFSFLDSLT